MNKIDFISHKRGTYLLIARSSVHRQIQIGKRGMLQLQPGWYVYVGSAFGAGGLVARVGRHLQRDKKQRWHMDYLRAYINIEEVWLSESQQSLEHQWANYFLLQNCFSIPLGKFGATDCRCIAHLFYAEKKPEWRAFSHCFAEFNCKQFVV